MKRMTLTVICAFICALALLSLCAGAANGDIAGQYYYTDIKTTMFNAPITSYNIGGVTVIDAEVLNWYYGFTVVWDENQRVLFIEENPYGVATLQAHAGEVYKSTDGKTGEVAGNYFETDIKTYMDGKEIASYNIGGVTCIVAEQLCDFGYAVAWNDGERTLSITKPADFYKVQSDFGTFRSVTKKGVVSQITQKLPAVENTRPIILEKDGETYTLDVPTGKIYTFGDVAPKNYITLADMLRIMGAACEVVEKENFKEEFGNSVAEYSYAFHINYEPQLVLQAKKAQAVPEDNGVFINEGEYAHFPAVVTLNGASSAFTALRYAMMKGMVPYDAGFIVYNGKCMVPVYTIATWLGYDIAN